VKPSSFRRAAAGARGLQFGRWPGVVRLRVAKFSGPGSLVSWKESGASVPGKKKRSKGISGVGTIPKMFLNEKKNGCIYCRRQKKLVILRGRVVCGPKEFSN